MPRRRTVVSAVLVALVLVLSYVASFLGGFLGGEEEESALRGKDAPVPTGYVLLADDSPVPDCRERYARPERSRSRDRVHWRFAGDHRLRLDRHGSRDSIRIIPVQPDRTDTLGRGDA